MGYEACNTSAVLYLKPLIEFIHRLVHCCKVYILEFGFGLVYFLVNFVLALNYRFLVGDLGEETLKKNTEIPISIGI